jgi:hypothetical protein
MSERDRHPEVRRCPRCERELPVEEFAVDASKASGRKSHCKACDGDKSKRYYGANRERRLAYMAARNARLREAASRGRRSTRRRAA